MDQDEREDYSQACALPIGARLVDRMWADGPAVEEGVHQLLFKEADSFPSGHIDSSRRRHSQLEHYSLVANDREALTAIILSWGLVEATDRRRGAITAEVLAIILALLSEVRREGSALRALRDRSQRLLDVSYLMFYRSTHVDRGLKRWQQSD